MDLLFVLFVMCMVCVFSELGLILLMGFVGFILMGGMMLFFDYCCDLGWYWRRRFKRSYGKILL